MQQNSFRALFRTCNEKTLVHFSYCKGWILAFLVWKGFFHKSDIIIIMFIIMFIINNNASFVESLYTSRLFVSSPLQLKFPLHMLYPFLHCMDIAFLSYSRMLMLFYVFSEFLRISTRFASLAAWPASIHEYTIRSGLRWCFFHQHWSSNWCMLQAISMGRRQRQKVQMFGVAVHRLHSVVLTEARARRKCLSDKIRLDPISLICPALWSRACNFPRRFRYLRLVRVDPLPLGSWVKRVIDTWWVALVMGHGFSRSRISLGDPFPSLTTMTSGYLTFDLWRLHAQ